MTFEIQIAVEPPINGGPYDADDFWETVDSADTLGDAQTQLAQLKREWPEKTFRIWTDQPPN